MKHTEIYTYTVVAYSTFSIYFSYNIIYVAIHVLAIAQVASYIHWDSAHIN